MSAVVFIPLTQGKVATIDFEDFEKVRQFKWRASKNRTSWYAKTTFGKEDHYLHRLLFSEPLGVWIDHRDGDGLNNQRHNLRTCSVPQNIRNQKIKSSNTSGFKGVSFRRDCKKWAAHIRHSGRKHHLGFFSTAELAALAYDNAAKKYHGDFAKGNFI